MVGKRGSREGGAWDGRIGLKKRPEETLKRPAAYKLKSLGVYRIWRAAPPRVRNPWTRKKTRRKGGFGKNGCGASYFCQVRFLCRLAFKRLRRLCLFIFSRRFFFRLPMVF
jgi:hypothetical protein